MATDLSLRQKYSSYQCSHIFHVLSLRSKVQQNWNSTLAPSYSLHIFTLPVSLNPGLRLQNSTSRNVISLSLDSIGVNLGKIIIIDFSLFKYKINVIHTIYHFVIELLSSKGQISYHHEWLKFCQSQWRYVTCTSSELGCLKDCYLSQHFFSVTLWVNYDFSMYGYKDLRIKISLLTFNYT